MIQGRYITRCKYHVWNGGRRIEYEPTLHPQAPRFVVHDPDAIDAATGEWVAVSLGYQVFKFMAEIGMEPGAAIAGAVWQPAYVWPPVVPPPEPVPTPAPQEEVAAFVSAGLALRSALTKNIVVHWKTHIAVEDDPVVSVVNWLLSIAARAEELEGD